MQHPILAQAPTAAGDVYSAGVAMAKALVLHITHSFCGVLKTGVSESSIIQLVWAKAFMGLDLQVAACLRLRRFLL